LYRCDWSIKPNGQAWQDLVFKTWWTKTSGSSDAQGRYQTRGFLGRYEVAVTANGKTVKQTATLEKTGREVTVTLP
jgi:hypothetical protein